MENYTGAWRHDHGHLSNIPTDDRALVRENCAACILAGYCPDCGRHRIGCPHQVERGPNYAGWARVYVGDRRPIPAKWRAAFTRELERTDNPAYLAALLADIAANGVRFEA